MNTKKEELKEILTAEAILENEIESIKDLEETEDYKGFKVSELRRIFEKFQCPINWKNPFQAVIYKKEFNKLSAAVNFFHGAVLFIEKEQKIGSHEYITCITPGYQCW